MSFSQNNEEFIIVDYLKGVTGRFCDVGAFDGKTFSNTLRLVELGWSGVCVEPSPTVFPKLMETHKGNTKITLVQAAITADPASKVAIWYDSGGDAISTTNIAHKQKWEAGYGSHFQSFYVWMLPVASLFATFGYDFEFINLDVESANLEIFLELPWPKLAKTRLICVEHDGHYQQMMEFAKAFGFKQISMNGENLLMAR